MVARQPVMSCSSLGRVVREHLPAAEGEAGVWRADVDGIEVYVLADEGADRVRVMSPVVRADRDDHELLLVLLSANFDRALDAHYAVQNGVAWCLFVHTLSGLTSEGLGKAIKAVLTLARNTGTTFASGDVRFTGTLGVEGGVP